MKSNDKILNIIIYVIIGLMVIVGIIFFIPESKEEKPSDNNDKKDEIVITFTTTDTNITLKKGETKKINYSLSGDYNINWFSSNNSVVQVQNAEIKAIMKSFVVSKYETDDYKATYSIVKKETMNEEKLLEILIPAVPSNLGIIKTKQYIDYDALENAIYKGFISDETILEMDKAKEVKETVTLRVTKKKKEKDE